MGSNSVYFYLLILFIVIRNTSLWIYSATCNRFLDRSSVLILQASNATDWCAVCRWRVSMSQLIVVFRCLTENNWDYTKAAQIFVELNVRIIPEHYLLWFRTLLVGFILLY